MSYRPMLIFAILVLAATAARAGLEAVTDETPSATEVAQAEPAAAAEAEPPLDVPATNEVVAEDAALAEAEAVEEPAVVEAAEIEEAIVEDEPATEVPSDESSPEATAQPAPPREVSPSPSDIELPPEPEPEPEPKAIDATDEEPAAEQNVAQQQQVVVDQPCPAPAACEPVQAAPCQPVCTPCGNHQRVMRFRGCRLFRCW